MAHWTDPLTWVLAFREVTLRFSGYRRLLNKEEPGRFGYYLRRGDEGKPVVVLIHGLALFPEWWYPLLKVMPSSYPVCVPELLGFSRSPGRELEPSQFTMRLFREQILHLKEKMKWDRMILAGVSLGGWVCLDYALAHPDGVEGLVLLAPAGVNPNVDEEDLRSLREIFDYKTPEDFVRLINDYVLLRPRRITRWVSAGAVRRSMRNGHKHLLNNLCFEDWIGRRAAAIRAPAALIWGREDKVFPIAVGEELARMMKGARLFPLEDTAHSYLFERPGRTCRAFLEGLAYVSGETV